jgi:hypothetical protein
MDWEYRKGRLFDLILVQKVLIFILISTSGIDIIDEYPIYEYPIFEYPIFEYPMFEYSIFEYPTFEYPIFDLSDQLDKTLVPQYLYSWDEMKIFSMMKNQRIDVLYRYNMDKMD